MHYSLMVSDSHHMLGCNFQHCKFANTGSVAIFNIVSLQQLLKLDFHFCSGES